MKHFKNHKFPMRGFTLAELLISLAILGVIATFTIPKVLTSQQDGKYKASAKEAASMISAAYVAYLADNPKVSTVGIANLTPYLNYVRVDTTSTVDGLYGTAADTCSAGYPCLRLHSGATLLYSGGDNFGGTATTNAVWCHFDPDGTYGNTTNGPGKAMSFFLYFNGRLSDEGSILSNTQSAGGTYNPNAALVPPWFSWN